MIKTWSLFAKSCAKVFAKEFNYGNKDDYYELDQLLIELIKTLNKVIADIFIY